MSISRSASEIDAEAARWVLRLDREKASASLEAELEVWLDADNRCRGALLKAEAAWLLLDGARMHAPTPVPMAEYVPSLSFARLSFAARLSRRSVLGGVGALVAAGIAAVVVLPVDGDRYRTEVGEVRRVALADRSTAAINTASGIDVVYEKKQRRVRIRRGEVWFQVAKDSARPFVVEAGAVRVEAVGTAFSVRRRDAGADVLVTEGVVRAWVTGAEGTVTRVEAGSKAFVADDAAVTKAVARPSELDRALAWRAGKIDLAGETLAEAVSEFNRYNVRQIVIGDAAAGEKRLYGVFRIDDPEGFAKAAAVTLGVRASSMPGGGITLASTL